jgi:ABC-type Fe3+/spermidine/putrescine transport system ATPase subunit
LSVQKNVAYGLEARHVPASEIEPRVTEALEMVGLAGHRQTFPRQLSGGQQQRVALARALVVRPSILLLDEPLSNLDTLLRKTMRQEIHDILKRVGTTAVMVTHDQEEALVIADRILLMSQGRIDQIGSPREIYENPRSVFGARFMASENLIKGTVTTANESVVVVDTAIGQIACRPSPDDVTVGQSVTVTVRPERIAISALPATGDHLNRVSARIQSVSYIGTYERILCTKDGHELIVHAPISPEGSRISSNVELSWIPCDTRVLVR